MWFDLIVIGVLIVFAIRGAVKGFVYQLATISALILCFAFAEFASVFVAPAIPTAAPLNRWIAMVLVYLVSSFLCFWLALKLKNAMEKAKFEEYDRHLGGVFGLVKGVVLCLVMTFFAVTLSESIRGEVLASRSGYVAAIIMDQLHPVMPEELHAILEPYIHQLDQPGMPLEHGRDHDDPGAEIVDTPADDPFASDPPAFLFREPIQSGLISLLGSASERDRERITNFLASATEREASDLLASWSQTEPNTPVTTPPSEMEPFDEPSGQPVDRERLFAEALPLFSDDPVTQSQMKAEFVTALQGIPDGVGDAALADWHADHLKLDDPDPGTDFVTSFNDRIKRQLRLAGIPVNRLGADVQRRIRE